MKEQVPYLYLITYLLGLRLGNFLGGGGGGGARKFWCHKHKKGTNGNNGFTPTHFAREVIRG